MFMPSYDIVTLFCDFACWFKWEFIDLGLSRKDYNSSDFLFVKYRATTGKPKSDWDLEFKRWVK